MAPLVPFISHNLYVFSLLSRVAQLWNKFRILSNSLALRAAALPTFASQAIPIQFSTVSRLSFEQ